MHRLSEALAIEMARVAIENIGREYPNAPGHLLRSANDLHPPRELHPAFFGSWDWHSSVHQHWLLVRLLRLDRAGELTADARRALAASLTPERLATEAAYLLEHPAFERTYGWAWLLRLGAWFDRFLPSVPSSLLEPAIVSDRSDPKTVHLDGLNLARAWSWRRIAAGLSDDPRARAAAAAGETHLDAALPHLFSGEYAGEHWVTTFALLALTD